MIPFADFNLKGMFDDIVLQHFQFVVDWPSGSPESIDQRLYQMDQLFNLLAFLLGKRFLLAFSSDDTVFVQNRSIEFIVNGLYILLHG